MPISSHHTLSWAHPIVREWFLNQYGSPTEPQNQGWPSIISKKNTLISAPTGSGKTFSAFLVCIDDLFREALEGKLEDKTTVLYISPLKALSNDIHKNLLLPLTAIDELAKNKGYNPSSIRVSVRTGDTLQTERQAMLRKPPHILVTTPESFYILLTATKTRELLKTIETVIIDEIHALVDDKRGAHLALSLERLEVLTHNTPVRIGLSATQKPLSMVAQFLIGNRSKQPTVIDIGHIRELDLNIEVPASELGAVASNEMWDEIYDRIATLAEQNRSTLVFVNTRRLAERVAHHLSERLGEDKVASHHGSLSRKIRLAAEQKLKNGELKALVATASLELGIDIGSIDLVCQIGSPRSIAVGLQRIGRAGHWRGAISKGRFFATTRNELIELAALLYAIKQGDLDHLILPPAPLDVLAQQIVAACAAEDWDENKLFQLIKKAYPFQILSREEFNSVVIMLSEGIAGTRGRYGAYLMRDQVNQVIKARRGARITAIMNGGAIPDNGLFSVIAEPDNSLVGTLDEDFAVESNRGDIILLGSTSWKIKRVESTSGRVLVEDAHGAPPSVPFWRGEAPARTDELSFYVSKLRSEVDGLTPKQILSLEEIRQTEPGQKGVLWLKEHCGVDASGAEQIIEYLVKGRALLGVMPTQNTIVAERFFDEAGGMQLILHAPFGARINKAWGLALRKRFCRSFNFELQASATDDGINIALAEQHSFPLADVFQFLHSNTIDHVLTQAVLQSPLFPTRWRWAATRSLALPRFRNGKKVPPHIQRMLSDDLLASVFPEAEACQDNLGGKDIEPPDHPLVNEAMKDTLTEALDLEGLKKVLDNMLSGKIQTVAVDTPVPSLFSHEILNANPYAFLDDAPLEERRARAVEIRRVLPDHLLEEVGKLDQGIIREIQQQIWPDIRNEDELHDVLQTLVAFPEENNFYSDVATEWHGFFQQLNEQGRVGKARVANKCYWFTAEKKKSFQLIYPHAEFLLEPGFISDDKSSFEEVLQTLLKGWFQHLGPTTTLELSQLLSLPLSDIEQAVLNLESTGLLLRGHFRTVSEIEWCERRILARIHRSTIGKLRKEIEPISPAQFYRWLFRWQHLTPDTQLSGEKGLFEVIKQLQAYELPAKAWERHIFAKRVKDYNSMMLDHLSLSGVIGWGRFSALSSSSDKKDDSKLKKRIIPTSVAPITFFVREDSDWFTSNSFESDSFERLSHVAMKIYEYLKQKGASFFSDLVKGVNHLKSEVETALWELVTAGLITADGFDNLRALIDTRRRLDKRFHHAQVRFSSGRWYLLKKDESVDTNAQFESICKVLLNRYGVVFRDLILREKNIPRWRDLLITFRRMEAKGDIRGGRFVSGFLGEQFALPYAVESLRAARKQIEEPKEFVLSAVDPLNLVGTLVPGVRIPSLTTKKVIWYDEGTQNDQEQK